MTQSHGYYFEDLSVGMNETFTKTVTEDDIAKFADVSGDDNPLHLDPEFAKQTPFKGCIAHGIQSVGFISAIIGTKMPGPGAIYMAQNTRFLAPVRPGDTVVTEVSITELIPEKKRAKLKTECFVGDTMVIGGDALVMVPSKG